MKHIHFIGICGVAMSAIAIAMKKAGYKITGSDKGFYPPVSDNLKKNKIKFYPGWHPEKMIEKEKPNFVVVGNVASSSNPEFKYIIENKIPYKSYPEVISEFFVRQNSIVCAGTYGKTTSSALLAWIFEQEKLSPSYMIGGVPINKFEPAKIGSGKWSVLEGDEYKSARWDSKAKFFHYSPTHLLLTSVVWDHADIYPTEESYISAFKKLCKLVPQTGKKIISEQAQKIIKQKNCITYGRDEHNDYQYKNVLHSKVGLAFDIINKNKTYKINTASIGEFMAKNITGCFALASLIGIDPVRIIKHIKSFKNIKRRLEKRLDGPVYIYDDIAHSPSKALSVLKTLKKIHEGKIFAIFEPNTGYRMASISANYNNAFEYADEVIIPELTKLKENPNALEKPMNGNEIAKIISKTHNASIYINNDGQVLNYLQKKAKQDDIIVFLGSHGFRNMIEESVKQFKKLACKPV
jgi:UDP-N-acetylmuramate: L-alanyl-gamma-D-glutamyl-meso-diaminopimelate ligase